MLRKILKEDLVDPLLAKLSGRLRSVIAFGSVVPFLDEVEPPMLANVNVLILVDAFDLEVTEAVRGVIAPRDQESLAVNLMEEEDLPSMAQVFPVEMQQLQASRVILHGRDPLEFLHVPQQNLESQIRFELLSKRQLLRSLLLRRAPSEPEIGSQLLSMAQAFSPLARGLLGARGISLTGLEELLAWLGRHGGLTPAGAEAVRDLQATREDRRRPAAAEKRAILVAFLQAWECLCRLPGGLRRGSRTLHGGSRGNRGRLRRRPRRRDRR